MASISQYAFIFSLIVVFTNSQTVTSQRFKRFLEYDDTTCQLDDVLFSQTAGSAMLCLTLCGQHDTCYSAFFSKSTKTCIGCENMYDETNPPDSAAGFICYQTDTGRLSKIC